MIPPTPVEWAIIKRYSYRVRELVILCDTQSLRFLKCIGSQSLTAPLSPNLKSLFWHPRVEQIHRSVALIQSLLSLSLIKLEATLTESDGPSLRTFLQNYHLHCPNLKTVVFSFAETRLISDVTKHELSRAICHHENLERLTLSSPIGDAALRHLAMCPTLKVLAVVYLPRNLTQQHQMCFLPEDIPFYQVKKFDLETSDLDFATTLLRPQDQIFHSFGLHLHDRPSAKAMSTFFSALVLHPSTTPLRDLRFKFAESSLLVDADQPTAEEVRVYCLTYQSFRPLASLAFLRELVIDWQYQISLDDDELGDLARSWPSLQHLNLHCRRVAYHLPLTKYVTLKGLLVLIASCPDLETLCLPIDAREVPMDDENNVSVCNTAIRCLRFPESPINEARPVAEFLFKHFPSVTYVLSTFQQLDLPHRRTWTEVMRYLSSLRQYGGE